MGREVSYLPLPRFPEEMTDHKTLGTRQKVLIGCGCCIAVPWILFFVCLGLYLSVKFSDSAVILEKCQSELQNQTSSAKAAISSFQQFVEATEKKEKAARIEINRLRTELEATNQSLLEMKGHWESCQSQLKTLEQNLTAQMEEVMQQEMKKCQADTAELQRQLSEKTQELEDAMHHSQRQGEECDAKIQEMQTHNKLSASTCSGGGVLRGPVPAFFALAVSGFSFFL